MSTPTATPRRSENLRTTTQQLQPQHSRGHSHIHNTAAVTATTRQEPPQRPLLTHHEGQTGCPTNVNLDINLGTHAGGCTGYRHAPRITLTHAQGERERRYNLNNRSWMRIVHVWLWVLGVVITNYTWSRPEKVLCPYCLFPSTHTALAQDNTWHLSTLRASLT